MDRLVTLEGVISGQVTLMHLIKLNALMQARDYQQAGQNEEH